MHFSFITLFPDIFKIYLNTSILGRAIKDDLFSYSVHNIKDFGKGNYNAVDDRPYGGGAGMVMRADVLADTLKTAFLERNLDIDNYLKNEVSVVVTSASGTRYKQSDAVEMSKLKEVFIICGHYEGIDQRFIDKYADQVICIGEYVLTGGELAALIITDSIVRLMPDVVGNKQSIIDESFSSQYISEHPQFTRPAEFEGKKVPDVLISGNHQLIQEWKIKSSKR